MNIFTRAKEIRAKHPRKVWAACVEQAGREVKRKVSGVKTAKKAKAKKVPAKRPNESKVVSVKVSGTGKKRQNSALGAIGKGRQIMGNINKMEAQYKGEKSKEMKKIIATLINAEHDKLDALVKLKKRVK